MVAICTTLSLTSCGKSAKKDYTMYIKDEGVNISDSEEGSQVWQLTDSPANSELYRYDVLWEDVSDDLVRISEDGKYIFYVENLNLFQEEYGSRWSFALYYREVDKPEEEAILIASDVLHYEVNSKATIVTYCDCDYDLHQYKIGEGSTETIESGVRDFDASGDGKTIGCWGGKAVHSALSIYREGKSEKVSDNVYMYSYTVLDDGRIYFLRKNNSDTMAEELCVWENGSTRTIANEVDNMYLSKNGKYIFYGRHDTGVRFNLYYNEVDKPEKAAVEIASNVLCYTVNSDSTLVTYYRERSENGEWKNGLYQYKIGERTTEVIDSGIESGVTCFDVSDDGTTIGYINDWDAERKSGTLYVWQKKGGMRASEQRVAVDVHSCTVTEGGRILYLCNYDLDIWKGELHVWEKGNSKMIEDDVASIIRDEKDIYKYKGIGTYALSDLYWD